jgi:hypothetical protein
LTSYCNRYILFTGDDQTGDTEIESAKGTKGVITMYEMVAVELMRQRREQVEREADRARLVREARLRRRRGDRPAGR